MQRIDRKAVVNLFLGSNNLSFPTEAKRRALTAINLVVALFFVVNRILRAINDPSRGPLLTLFEYSIFTIIFIIIYLLMRFKYYELMNYVSVVSIYSFILIVIYLSPEQSYGFLLLIPMSISFMLLSNKENFILSVISAIFVLNIIKDRGNFDGFMTQVILLIGILFIFIIQKRLQSDIEEYNINRLERRKEQVIRSNKMYVLNRMSTGVFHDLNNYHMIISNHISFLIENTEPGTQNYDDLEVLRDITDKSILLLQKMRSTSDEEKTYIHLPSLFEVISKSIKPLIHADVNYQALSEDITIYGFESQLIQVLINILTNSIDAIDESGNLSLNARIIEDAVVISVEDDGYGIDKDLISNVFDTFFTTKKHGTGIGLALSREIVEKSFNGTIDVISEPGVRTVFSIIIPK